MNRPPLHGPDEDAEALDNGVQRVTRARLRVPVARLLTLLPSAYRRCGASFAMP